MFHSVCSHYQLFAFFMRDFNFMESHLLIFFSKIYFIHVCV